MGSVDEFLGGLADSKRAVLQRAHDVVGRLAPEAVQGTSYGLAAYMVSGKPLLAFNDTARHLSLYPFSPAVVAAVAPDLPGFSLSKGTIRFTETKPVPDSVLERIVALRLAEINAETTTGWPGATPPIGFA